MNTNIQVTTLINSEIGKRKAVIIKIYQEQREEFYDSECNRDVRTLTWMICYCDNMLLEVLREEYDSMSNTWNDEIIILANDCHIPEYDKLLM